ncbi:hypothetical protein ACFVZ2_45955, partial [Streptomyces lasiicapitis]
PKRSVGGVPQTAWGAGGRGGGSAQALANRTGRPVTTYQSAECDETAEFNTYPGSGTWAPESPYRVRAFKIWER